MDSGASTHMVNDKTLFCFLNDKKSEILVAKKNETMKAEGQGQITGVECILKNVTYVPDLSKNLLSVNAITNNGGEVKFTKDGVIVMRNQEVILKGKKQENGLYIVNIRKEKEESMLTEVNEKTDEWHRKLAHLSIRNMQKLIDMSTGMNITKTDCENEKNVCETCVQAKQVRFPFINTRSRAKRPLELIHSDLCGPIDPLTWDNKKYILTILDDYIHFGVIYLLERKNETANYLKKYIAEMETSKNLKVAKLRCDNRKEYVNTELIKFCKGKGIVMQTTIPHTPQLNGKSERLNRTLIEKTRAV